MQKALHPNKLRSLLAMAGLNQREAAHEAGIPEGTFRHYIAGDQIIPKRDRAKLAQVIGCDIQDLAPQYSEALLRAKKSESYSLMRDEEKPLSTLESNGFFSFGKLASALVVLDGNGVEAYTPESIRTFYDGRAMSFIDSIERTKEIIAKEQAQNELSGQPFYWNGNMYHLAEYVLSRDAIHEHMRLHLWFHPTDYYTVLAKNRYLEENTAWRNTAPTDLEIPLHTLPIPFGIGLSLLTVDGYIIFAQRGGDLGVRPGHFMTSVEEGLNRPLDRSVTSEAPDVYRCACRGLSEELGLSENEDFSSADILFLSLGLDTEYYMCGLRGLVKARRTAQEILHNWQLGVKDKMENKKLFAVPFIPEEVCAFVFAHQPWGGGALMGIYHTLIHEFGRERVHNALTQI